MAIEIKNTRVKMIKPLYLGMSILYISKTLMYEFKYGYIGPKYGDNCVINCVILIVLSLTLKVHSCRFENLSICLCCV